MQRTISWLLCVQRDHKSTLTKNKRWCRNYNFSTGIKLNYITSVNIETSPYIFRKHCSKSHFFLKQLQFLTIFLFNDLNKPWVNDKRLCFIVDDRNFSKKLVQTDFNWYLESSPSQKDWLWCKDRRKRKGLYAYYL